MFSFSGSPERARVAQWGYLQGGYLTIWVVKVARALRLLLLIVLVAGVAGATARAASSVAEDIYAAAPPRLLQIRTLVNGAGQQS